MWLLRSTIQRWRNDAGIATLPPGIPTKQLIKFARKHTRQQKLTVSQFPPWLTLIFSITPEQKRTNNPVSHVHIKLYYSTTSAKFHPIWKASFKWTIFSRSYFALKMVPNHFVPQLSNLFTHTSTIWAIVQYLVCCFPSALQSVQWRGLFCSTIVS